VVVGGVVVGGVVVGGVVLGGVVLGGVVVGGVVVGGVVLVGGITKVVRGTAFDGTSTSKRWSVALGGNGMTGGGSFSRSPGISTGALVTTDLLLALRASVVTVPVPNGRRSASRTPPPALMMVLGL